MKVIMLKDVAKIGRKGEIREVADGYAINYLIPQHMAEKATADKIRMVEMKMKGKEEAGKANAEKLAKAISSLSGQTIPLRVKLNEKGHLYRELKGKDIAAAIKENIGLEIPESSIKISHVKEGGKISVPIEGGGEKGHFELDITNA